MNDRNNQAKWLTEWENITKFKKKHLSKVTIPIPLIGQTEKINGCFASLDAAQCPQAFFYKLCLQVVVIVYSVRLGFVLVDDGSPPTQVYSRLDNLQVIISHVDRLTSGFQKLVLLFITHSSWISVVMPNQLLTVILGLWTHKSSRHFSQLSSKLGRKTHNISLWMKTITPPISW